MSQSYIAMTGLSLTENLGSQMWHFASLYAISRRTGHRIVFFREHADLGKGLRLHRHFAGLPFELVSIESLSEAERRAGWKLLFDGTSPDAFRNFRKEGLGAGWQVRDGSLVRAAKGSR